MGIKRDIKSITHLIIHCSASPNGRVVSARYIDNWHAERGFKRDMWIDPQFNAHLLHIGYHYVINISGTLETGRPLTETGAHCAEKAPDGRVYNSFSIGVCMSGTDKFSEAQWETLASLVSTLQKLIPYLIVLGHRDTSPDRNRDGIIQKSEWVKTCPGFDVSKWLGMGKRPYGANIL